MLDRNNDGEDSKEQFVEFALRFLSDLPPRMKKEIKSREDLYRLLESSLYEVYAHLNGTLTQVDVTDYLEGPFREGIEKYVSARFIKSEDSQTWELAIIIGEDTTLDQIKISWPALLEYRNALRTLQGPEKGSELEYFEKQHQAGVSYNRIAQDINYELLVLVARSILEDDNLEGTWAALFFYLLLERFGKKDSGLWLQIGRSEITEGKLPWTRKKGPIDSIRVRDYLRRWNEIKDMQQIDDNKIGKWEMPSKHNPIEYEPAIQLIEKLEKTG